MKIEKVNNQLTFTKDFYITEISDGSSINKIISSNNIVHDTPFYAMVNGVPLKRVHWNDFLNDGDICHFVNLPQGGGGGDSNGGRIFAMFAVMALSVLAGGAPMFGAYAGFAQGAIMLGGSLLVNQLFPAELPEIESDEIRIVQILQNFFIRYVPLILCQCFGEFGFKIFHVFISSPYFIFSHITG